MEHYAKLFDLSWIEPWLVEAMVVMALGLILVMILSRLAQWINGEDK
jgi:type II secretory pathway component PulL